MTRRRKQEPATFTIFQGPQVRAQRKELPGNVRQRIKRAIDGLSMDPRPPQSRKLDLSKVQNVDALPQAIELRRLRLDRWRVVYAIDEEWKSVFLLAIRRRPPYDYGDLGRLLSELARN